MYKFAKAYADLRSEVIGALQAYATDVRTSAFPDDAHSFH